MNSPMPDRHKKNEMNKKRKEVEKKEQFGKMYS